MKPQNIILLFSFFLFGITVLNAQNGNVGINTATPTNTLHVNATADPLRLQGLQAASASAYNTLAVDATGVVKLRNASSVSAVRATGNITFILNNTTYFTDVTAAPAETIDNLNEFSGHTFTATQAGLYQVSFMINFLQRTNANDSGDGYVGALHILSGTATGSPETAPLYSSTAGKISLPEIGGATVNNQVNITDLVKLTAGQVIQFQTWVFGTTGGVTGSYCINIVRVD